jgi:selenide,water dikinase
VLAQVLRQLPRPDSRQLLVGYDKADDAAVFKLSDDMALVLTVDFITPIADDPYTFGQIAAANSLSDVFAMGGTPLAALSIVGFPARKLGPEVLTEMLRGGSDKTREAGAFIVGGHTVEDHEVKFGLSVAGLVHPDRIVSNAGCRPGDELFLTKPLGVGIVTTAIMQGKATAAAERAALESMVQLNAAAARAMLAAGATAATDITGFGFLGHACEVADASGVTLEVEGAALPVLPQALELAVAGVLTGADGRNRRFLEDRVELAAGLTPGLAEVLFDAQTSGGLLIAVPAARADELGALLQREGVLAARLGRARERSGRAVRVG